MKRQNLLTTLLILLTLFFGIWLGKTFFAATASSTDEAKPPVEDTASVKKVPKVREPVPIKKEVTISKKKEREAAVDTADKQAKAVAEGQRAAAEKHTKYANAAVKKEFEGIRRFVYGTLIKENTENKVKLQKLKNNKQKYLAAGVSRTKYIATLALAKKRVEIRDARVVMDCYRVNMNCNYSHEKYDTSVALLAKYYKDKNSITSMQREEIKAFFEMSGLSKKLQ